MANPTYSEIAEIRMMPIFFVAVFPLSNFAEA